jgi:hypothetical protein
MAIVGLKTPLWSIFNYEVTMKFSDFIIIVLGAVGGLVGGLIYIWS